MAGIFASLWKTWRSSNGRKRSRASQRLSRTRGVGFKPILDMLEDRTLLSAGALDPSFGVGGKVIMDLQHTDFGDPSASYSTALQADGKILLAYAVNPAPSDPSAADFAVARLNKDGSLDTNFGDNGVQTIDFLAVAGGPNSRDFASDIAVQADGKIVVSGFAMAYELIDFGEVIELDTDFAVARLNANGSLDTSFGTAGKQIVDFGGSSHDRATGLAMQSDGKIIVAGTSFQGGFGSAMTVARLNTNGTLDVSFGNSGKDMVDFPEEWDTAFFGHSGRAHDVAIQPDGKIILVGEVAVDKLGSYWQSFAIARLNANGGLDLAFGTGGTQKIGMGPTYDSAFGVAVTASGKIVVAGFTDQHPNGSDFGLAQLNSDGSLDLAFGTGGKQVTDFGSGQDGARAVAIQPADGKIVVSGSTYQDGTGYEFALARFNGDGSLDSSFGSGGKALIDFGTGYALNCDVALQPDGNIIVVGMAAGSSVFRIAAARLHGGLPTFFVLSGSALGQAMVGEIRNQAVDTGNASSLALHDANGQFLFTLNGENLNYVGGGSAIKGTAYFTSNVTNGTKLKDISYLYSVTFYDAFGNAFQLDAFAGAIS